MQGLLVGGRRRRRSSGPGSPGATRCPSGPGRPAPRWWRPTAAGSSPSSSAARGCAGATPSRPWTAGRWSPSPGSSSPTASPGSSNRYGERRPGPDRLPDRGRAPGHSRHPRRDQEGRGIGMSARITPQASSPHVTFLGLARAPGAVERVERRPCPARVNSKSNTCAFSSIRSRWVDLGMIRSRAAGTSAAGPARASGPPARRSAGRPDGRRYRPVPRGAVGLDQDAAAAHASSSARRYSNGLNCTWLTTGRLVAVREHLVELGRC